MLPEVDKETRANASIEDGLERAITTLEQGGQTIEASRKQVLNSLLDQTLA